MADERQFFSRPRRYAAMLLASALVLLGIGAAAGIGNWIGSSVIGSFDVVCAFLVWRLGVRPVVEATTSELVIINPFSQCRLRLEDATPIRIERFAVHWYERGTGYAVFIGKGRARARCFALQSRRRDGLRAAVESLTRATEARTG